MCVEGFDPGAKDSYLCPQVVDGGEKGAEERNHCRLTEGNSLDVGYIDRRQQIKRKVWGVIPGTGDEVDEGLDYLIFGGGGHPERGEA